jgi:DNA modification methylase
MTRPFKIDCGDCLPILRSIPEHSIDSIVTDPPYGLAFMGKNWDRAVPPVEIWRECLRVLKPGGHLLSFAGTRTQHRMACAIEDAGFEIRDMIAWVYGSGFPKSLDVSKAIDKAAGAERETKRIQYSPQQLNCKAGQNERPWMKEAERVGYHELQGDTPATPAAAQWQGWGTALKPALEPITVARKPLIGTVAANVLAHGTGGLNVDGCRVGGWKPQVTQGVNRNATSWNVARERQLSGTSNEGRWPANLIHDGSDEVVGLFPETKSPSGTTVRSYGAYKTIGGSSNHRPCHDSGQTRETVNGFADSGSAARFFYCAKASKADRDDGCEGLEAKARPTMGSGIGGQPDQSKPNNRNTHPTVKPTALMRYLCRLVTPPGGIVLDPFMGSGSTGKAAILEGFRFVGIEREAKYCEIATARIQNVRRGLK